MVSKDSLALLFLVAAILVIMIGLQITLINPYSDAITSNDQWRSSDQNDSITDGQKRVADYVNNLALIFALGIGFNIIYRARGGA